MGGGKFVKIRQGLPNIPNATTCVKACDYDKDGDMDLFIGAKSIPGKYPFASPSVLLNFDKFKFNNLANTIKKDQDLGMITDAEWFDYDKDGWEDLILVGEWTTPRLFKNNKGTLDEVTSTTNLSKYNGWWQSVHTNDIDGDGDIDIVCGNFGLNSKFKASDKKPFKVYASDFDGNGTCDVILSKEYKGEEVPTRGRQCSSDQMPFIKKKFETYNDFANASVVDIIGKKGEASALKLAVNDFSSKIFLNDGKGNFEAKNLPIEAQKAPINGAIFNDFNNDGTKDMMVAGNIFETEVETSRYDAGIGDVLISIGQGGYQSLNVVESGIKANRNCKDVQTIKTAKGYYIIVANNDSQPQFFKLVE